MADGRMSTFLDKDGSIIAEEKIIGIGASGIVVLHERNAIKLPIRRPETRPQKVALDLAAFEREQDIHRRLQPTPETSVKGVISYIRLDHGLIELKYMENGSLLKWLRQPTAEITIGLQVKWFHQLATGLAHIHNHRVIHGDISCRNILMDKDLNVVLADFGHSSMFSMQRNMIANGRDTNGRTVWTDLCQLGGVFWSIATGDLVDIDMHKTNGSRDEVALPPRSALPSTDHIWASVLIDHCWIKGGYGDGANTLVETLECLQKGISTD
ncbi:uncharacterized protein N7479_009927 [Penicillium vulpinum]|uniref:EKC/KEOPS complex subunit BUD32 n=1 Tax=Penicillium vulpinum TaxID=29845 RepID=A0A1V6RYX0_9EURO|nr:uncharacterized protein N7479_009927 [Penicillium vulpinum]KAJ5951514.1 hypothetical protein N7479_009927 [Penicillium vulpinum]OQE06709.1 hypothetical protein PENVUL_c017G00941 [Penicillium vulpinum]